MLNVTPELKALRETIHCKALILSVNLQYSKRSEKIHQQGQYDALKELWDTYDFDNQVWIKEETTHDPILRET